MGQFTTNHTFFAKQKIFYDYKFPLWLYKNY